MSAMRDFWTNVVAPAPDSDGSANTSDGSPGQGSSDTSAPGGDSGQAPSADQSQQPDRLQGPLLRSITITPSEDTISGGVQLQFNAGGEFSNNSCRDITKEVDWSSSAPNLVSIDNNGVATSQAVSGTAMIKATDANTGLIATAFVTVDAGDAPQPSDPGPGCSETVYVQKGITYEEDGVASKVGETLLHVTEGGMVAFDIVQLIAGKVTVATFAAGLGAELIIAGGLFLIMAEKFPEDNKPRSLGCPALCPHCPQEACPADGVGGQCLNAPGHCGQHQCQHGHTWTGDGDSSQINGDQSGQASGGPSSQTNGDPSSQSNDDPSGGACHAPADSSQSSDGDGGVCQDPSSASQ